jgi:hypothetical protein
LPSEAEPPGMSEKELLLLVLGLVAVMMFTTGFVLATT